MGGEGLRVLGPGSGFRIGVQGLWALGPGFRDWGTGPVGTEFGDRGPGPVYQFRVQGTERLSPPPPCPYQSWKDLNSDCLRGSVSFLSARLATPLANSSLRQDTRAGQGRAGQARQGRTG